jgi:hypothetical protein
MTDNQSFIVKTNFIKNRIGKKHKEISEKLGLPRHIYDAYRVGKTKVPLNVYEKLAKEFPETKEINAESAKRSLENKLATKTKDELLNEAYGEIIKLQKETIVMLKTQLAKLKAELEAEGEEDLS